jgi:class 3 adenylate cyclase
LDSHDGNATLRSTRRAPIGQGTAVDPSLAAWASALNEAGDWAYLFDASWRLVFVSDELRRGYRDVTMPMGHHFYSREMMEFRRSTIRGSTVDLEFRRVQFLALAPAVLATTPGGREELRRIIDPEYDDLLDQIEPHEVPAVRHTRTDFTLAGTRVAGSNLLIRIDDANGRFAGVCLLLKPAAGMTRLAMAAGTGDLAHLERMRLIEVPDRRAAAVLMADLESSSPLARSLSTAQYFAFIRRLVRATDQQIVDAGGVVGRHAGDGVVAFFLPEIAGSESAAARSCIATARALRETLASTAARSEITDAALSLRFGLHWGATLYIGRIATAGRSEITALGDEVNEAARIEACATGGRALASKSLIERLSSADADALEIDHQPRYVPLGELPNATDKARRDAPSLAVCEV